jgi:surface antigen
MAPVLVPALLASLAWANLTVSPAAAADDYPYKNAVCAPTGKTTGSCPNYDWRVNGAEFDQWGFSFRNCTSFVAWRMNTTNAVGFTNGMRGGQWGNANHWDDNARTLGYAVNSTPARGAIAQTDDGNFGHVAWVDAVNGDGTVTVEDYNFAATGVYARRTVAASTYRYIHVQDITTPPPPPPHVPFDVDGNGRSDLVAFDGSTLRVMGWNATTGFGGPASQQTFGPMAWANGTFGRTSGSGVREAPSAPTAVSVAPGDFLAKVSFSPPASDGGSQVTSFTATAAPGGKSVTGTASPLTITGLDADTLYSFTLTATNAVGSSAPSAPITAKTSTASFTTTWSAQERPRLLKSATYLGQTPEQLQKTGIGLIEFLLALSNPRPPAEVAMPPSLVGPITYTSTWTAADIGQLRDVQAQYSLTPEQAQKFGVQLVSFLLILGGN